tara:strand:+ start:407 stop:733 length:327 start_codon:yes stop_codon:yes gene_type:complete
VAVLVAQDLVVEAVEQLQLELEINLLTEVVLVGQVQQLQLIQRQLQELEAVEVVLAQGQVHHLEDLVVEEMEQLLVDRTQQLEQQILVVEVEVVHQLTVIQVEMEVQE